MLSFTVPISTYNADQFLQECLQSINGQDYDRSKVQTLVIDGGSSDRTVEIARANGATVLDNPRRLADWGFKIGMREAIGDLLLVFAADNELVGRDWLQRASALFEADPELAAIWGPMVSGDDDSHLNQYYILIQNDPLSYYLNQNLSWYLKRATCDERFKSYHFRVRPDRPLIWGANGLVMRMSFVRHIVLRDEFIGDNDVFQIMLEEGHDKVAWVPTLNTVHHHVRSLRHWMTKWHRNYWSHFLTKRETRNLRWAFEPGWRWRFAGWIPYSIVPLVSGLHALRLAARDRNLHWLYHPVVAFLQTCVYAKITLTTREGRRMLQDVLVPRQSRDA